MRKKHSLKILIPSLLTAIGVLGVSASAAQADWVLLEGSGKTKVSSLSLTVSVSLGMFLVPGLGLSIHCKKGSGSLNIFDGNPIVFEKKTQFAECKDLNFGEVCTVRGSGDTTGSITTASLGLGSMTSKGSSDLFAAFSSTKEEASANIVYEGEECPLTEIDGVLSGSSKIEVKSPTTHTATHELEFVEQNLTFGDELMLLHDGKEPPMNVRGTVTRAGNIPVSIVLLGL